MEYKLNDMCSWEKQKAVFLIGVAEQLGMNLDSYGEVAVNSTSGYTYLWSEDYNFTLYMPINCELKKEDVYALWTNSNDGEERETSIKDMDLKDIEDWASKQKKSIEVEAE
jgi:hypothetical protein